MNGKSKLTHQNQEHQQEQSALQAHTRQRPAAHEFPNVEEMLRYDAAHTPLPAAVTDRVAASVERERLRAPRVWWKRLFGK
ncbi:MAG: hypothetical protein JXQ71_01990 [Verrucomicrobia bacterium]|nr:hypothetical protein [Verrucomicrobiota bacterium]